MPRPRWDADAAHTVAKVSATPLEFPVDRRAEAPSTPEVAPLPRTRWGDEQRRRESELFAIIADPGADERSKSAARDDIVVLHMPLVEYCARRFRDRGEPAGDLVGYGCIGLIKAVDRFDVTRGLEFSTFAMPTIIGEIKRHFRDRARIVRLPRRLIDVASEAAAVTPQLQVELGYQPQPHDVAARIGISVAEVIEAQRMTSTHAISSVDVLVESCSETGDILPQQLVVWPTEFETIEWRESLRPALSALSNTERELVHLRFVEQLSQEAIARRLGVSQMHVSRLLTRLLTHLRTVLADAA